MKDKLPKVLRLKSSDWKKRVAELKDATIFITDLSNLASDEKVIADCICSHKKLEDDMNVDYIIVLPQGVRYSPTDSIVMPQPDPKCVVLETQKTEWLLAK